MTGYRLSGSDMNSYVGRRVQIVGSVVPSTTSAANGTAGAMPEFRVQSVMPMTGPCSPQ